MKPRKVEAGPSEAAIGAAFAQAIAPQAPQAGASTPQAQPGLQEAPAQENAPAPTQEPAPRQRMRFGERRSRLSIDTILAAGGSPRPNFMPRWINDYPGRVNIAKSAGYEHIKDADGKPIEAVVDKHSGLKAFAMEIPKEFYDEDFAAKQEQEDAKEFAVLHGTIDEAGYRPTVGGTNKPRSTMQVLSGGRPV